MSYPYVRARGLRSTDRAAPLRFAAAVIARRALARDHPVTATSSSSTRPLSFFEARQYSLAYFFVISRRVAIDNRSPIAQAHRSARGRTQVSRAFLP